jgi:hypothetical protein
MPTDLAASNSKKRKIEDADNIKNETPEGGKGADDSSIKTAKSSADVAIGKGEPSSLEKPVEDRKADSEPSENQDKPSPPADITIASNEGKTDEKEDKNKVTTTDTNSNNLGINPASNPTATALNTSALLLGAPPSATIPPNFAAAMLMQAPGPPEAMGFSPKMDSESMMSGMSQSERKRFREKKRRSEITNAIDQLTKILLKVEPANLIQQNNLVYSTNSSDIPSRAGRSNGGSGGGGQQPLNRTEIINHAVQVLERLFRENEERKLQIMRLHSMVNDVTSGGNQQQMMMMPQPVSALL